MASNLSEISTILFKGLNSCTVNTHRLAVAVKLNAYEIFCPYRLTSIRYVLKMPGKTSGVSYPHKNDGEN
jgi:hypothetical protein